MDVFLIRKVELPQLPNSSQASEKGEVTSTKWPTSNSDALKGISGGSKQICSETAVSEALPKHLSLKSSLSDGEYSTVPIHAEQGSQHVQSASPVSNIAWVATSEIKPSNTLSSKTYDSGQVDEFKREAATSSSDVLERARAALASAERATAAARAAAELGNVKFGSLKLEGKST
ncbi:uncharacterized protein LOC110825466 [Carica papaya]|uniref:uncharacterized protein LOC110825466 n=1 Tax=Carica papaya TaxID=3649 RepID=UPI000B8CBF31|nr:uncharacterized protein LOC110825466 [Carica papaya]